MNRPHKTVEYDLDTVLSETETKSSLTIMSERGNGQTKLTASRRGMAISTTEPTSDGVESTKVGMA